MAYNYQQSPYPQSQYPPSYPPAQGGYPPQSPATAQAPPPPGGYPPVQRPSSEFLLFLGILNTQIG